MKGKSPDQNALNLFEPVLRQIVKPDHPITVLADSFPWSDIESEYSDLYSDKGAPAKPVRMMAGLLILKMIFRGSDGGIVVEWQRDPYFQYFCGGNVLVDKPPCNPGDLSRFRKRIGRERLDRLMKVFKELEESAGIGKIRVHDNSRPGKEGFSYSAETGFYNSVITGIRSLAGKLSGLFSKKISRPSVPEADHL